MGSEVFPKSPEDNGGIYLRDHIAIAAMQGMLANPKSFCDDPDRVDYILKLLVEMSYKIADAMIEEQERPSRELAETMKQ